MSLPAPGLSFPHRLPESAESAHSSGQCPHSAVQWVEGRGVRHTHAHTLHHTHTYVHAHTHTWVHVGYMYSY